MSDADSSAMDRRVARVERAIECHLATHLSAADTPEGIARWWLGGLAAPPELVAAALARLVGRRILRVRPRADGGGVLYRAAERTTRERGGVMATLNYNFAVQVSNGVQLTVSQQAEVEAVSRMEIKLTPDKAGAKDKAEAKDAAAASISEEFDIQPGPAAKVVLLLVKADHYAGALHCQISNGKAEGDSETMDLAGPLILSGEALKLARVDPPSRLKVTYTPPVTDKTKAVTLDILVARRVR